MTPAPIFETEWQRLQALLAYEILDTEREVAFDELTQLASMICGCPIAAISLIDSERQWFKSTTGLDKSVTETPRDISFCGHAIHQTEVFMVNDATRDDRFQDNPLVTGGLAVRFYAGAPLITADGQTIGALCVINQSAADLTDAQKQGLQALARQVMAQIELRKANRILRDNFKALQESAELVTDFQTKLAESSRLVSLGEMSAGIAHEINNPLAIVVGRAEVLIDRLQNQNLTPQKLEDGLQTIIKTCFRISKIVKGLKTFSRDASNETLVRTTIEEMIQDALAMCAERFKQAGVELRLDLEATEVVCQPVQVSQILLNLLNNAYDAVCDSKNAWVKVTAVKSNEGFTLSVTDSGSGIPEEIAAKVMQPFFTTKDVGHGMGMGLSISRGMAESQKGSLSIDKASPNTKFDLFIPNQADSKLPTAS